jgi:hypothetical protein
MSKKLWLLPLAVGLMATSPLVVGQDQTQQQDRVRTQDREQVYGSQLMTREERVAYRARMRTAKTQEEREKIRAEHHEQMKVRAKERGVTLPDAPPAMGGGMGLGGGMGPGGGMGGGPRGR